MTGKGDPADTPAAARRRSPLITAYSDICVLKRLLRQGWLRVGVAEERCESVADHSFGVALLSLFLAHRHFPALDPGRIARIALLHEIGEIDAGDITPHDGIDPEEKRRREAASVRRVLSPLAGGDGLIALWKEFEEGASPEARLVRQMDKLEMALQAGIYRLEGEGEMESFFRSAEEAVTDPRLIALIREVRDAGGEGWRKK